MFVQVETCRFLLHQTTFPDKDSAVSQALRSRDNDSSTGTWPLYKLLFPHYDDDAERLMQPSYPYGEPHFDLPPDEHCIQSMQNQFFASFSSKTMDERLELASLLGRNNYCLPHHFLQAAGLNSVSKALAVARTSTGKTALHYAAMMMAVSNQPAKVQAWTAFARELVLAEADICGIWVRCHAKITPLLSFLGLCCLEKVTKCVRLWIEMLQSCGVDLSSYGREENITLAQYHDAKTLRRITLFSESAILPGVYHVCRLEYGPVPQDWRCIVSREVYCRVFELQQMPGTWAVEDIATSSCLPSTICWRPIKREEEEHGMWMEVKSWRLERQEDAQAFAERLMSYDVEWLISCAQDDSGIVALRTQKASAAKRASRHRSKSQPPPLYRRIEEYLMHPQRPWDDPYRAFHLCPVSSRFEYCCSWNYTYRLGESLRRCYQDCEDDLYNWKQVIDDLRVIKQRAS